ELIVPWEAGGRLAAGGGAVAQPVGEFLGRRGIGAARTVGPGEAVGDVEGLDVGNAAILVALEAHALAARHGGQLCHGEDQELAVLTDDGHAIAFAGDEQFGLFSAADIEDLLALAGIGDDVVFGD